MVKKYRVGPPPHILIFRKHGKIAKVVVKPVITAYVRHPYLGRVIDMGALWEQDMGKEGKDA